MSSRFRSPAGPVAIALGVMLVMSCAVAAAERDLRVCADPDNLPYSRADGSGFENRIAEMLARDLGARLVYHWHPQWRGFVRKTLGARACDVIIGMPVGSERVRLTRPYYRSRYAFVTPTDAPPLASLDDPRVAALSIGLLLPGNDMAETPVGKALARRNITRNVHGYTPYGPRPAAERMIDDVESGRLDAAIVWGPQAGFFGQRQHRLMSVIPARGTPADEPLEFAIAMAVRPEDVALAGEIDASIARLGPRIDEILREYCVPRTDLAVVEGVAW